MGPAALLIGALISLYRVTLNLPDVPFSASLKNPEHAEYKEMTERVRNATMADLSQLDGFYNVSVLQFRYNAVIGTMVIFDVTFTHSTPEVEQKLRRVLKDGKFSSGLAVGSEGFEIVEHQANASHPTQRCADGSLPEFSLHGSTYCWSHAVCPTGYSCVNYQCCRTAQNQKRAAVHRCESGEFRCSSGECIPSYMECNRHYAYFNQARRQQEATRYHTAEAVSEQCSDQEVKCKLSNPIRCIHYEKLCDGVRDCERGEDEMDCGFVAPLPTTTQAGPADCAHRCKNGQCIPRESVCNRKYDCLDDGSDETQCEYFISAQRRHGVTESPEREEEYRRRQDEERRRIHAEHLRRMEEAQKERQRQEELVQSNAISEPENIEIVPLKTCHSHEFECRPGECIDKRRRCDGHRDCSNSADEFNCETGNVIGETTTVAGMFNLN